MVQKEIKFSDGTRIFYEDVKGNPQRFIQYSYTPEEREKIEKNPIIKDAIDSKKKKHNAGKYYYLEILRNLVSSLDDNQKRQLYDDLKALHDRTGQEYDSNIVNKEFLEIFGQYWSNNKVQCAAFFTTIYLAMVDLEGSKWKYPNSLGKTMVLKSCEAVILGGKDPKEAATMFEKRKRSVPDGYFDMEYDSRYEKYNGYNGYDDDTIDIAFDGFPEATWNVD